MARFIDASGIVPVIDSVYSTEDAASAFARLDTGPTGKIVLTRSFDPS